MQQRVRFDFSIKPFVLSSVFHQKLSFTSVRRFVKQPNFRNSKRNFFRTGFPDRSRPVWKPADPTGERHFLVNIFWQLVLQSSELEVVQQQARLHRPSCFWRSRKFKSFEFERKLSRRSQRYFFSSLQPRIPQRFLQQG